MRRQEWSPLAANSVLLLLWSHYLGSYVSWWAALGWLGACHFLALIQIRLRVKPLLALLQILLFPLILRLLLFVGLRLLANEQAAPWDILYPLYDRYLILVYPAGALHWVLTLVSAWLKGFAAWRGLIHLAILVGIFSLPGFQISQGAWAIPTTLAVSAAMLLFELEMLRRENRQLGWGLPPLWAFGLLPLILAGLSLAYLSFSKNKAGEQAGLLQPTLFGYDFTPLVQLENQISMSDNLIFVFKKDGPPASHLLRRQVLNTYDPSRGFYAEPRWLSASEAALEMLGSGLLLPGLSSRLREPLVYDILAVNLEPTSLVAINEPESVDRLGGYDPRRFRGAYRVRSQVLVPNLARVARTPAEAGVSQEYWDFHTHVPPDPELQNLAQSLTRGLVDPTRKAERLVKYFHDEFYYSLKPSIPPGQDPLRYFLFESRKGYCSYFAFSMVLMLRHLNIPSRLAVGFFTDPQRQVLGYYPVRGFQAHAWVEVLSDGEGWISYDPTSSQLAPGEDLVFGADTGDDFFQLVESLLAQELSPIQEPKTIISSGGRPTGTAFLWPLMLVAVLVLAVLKYRYRLLIWLIKNPRQRVFWYYRLLRRKIEAGLDRVPQNLTAARFAQIVGNEPFQKITDIYLEAKFSDHHVDDTRIQELTELEQQLPRIQILPRFWRWFWY